MTFSNPAKGECATIATGPSASARQVYGAGGTSSRRLSARQSDVI
ncbi:hypothetical protein VOI32_17895 [Paraburkholderia caribensis]|uniref:Uncharacterized protein n=1 Tax=Paraburkholderia caribensis TaxID=75105 RepID=A0ABV0DZE4_9BURK|nr:hypothetical protein [Paraburkholderia caribensis]